ncbi:MAG: exodeoxyribonuclease VII small subunit [bacterium]|nr:exodeoxyribonuclease VII small subunit [bacterium]
MAKEKPSAENLNNSLKRLAEITEWFDNQEEIDVEEGLKKVKEAVELIKASKGRLKTIENEFEEIKKGIEMDEEKKEDDGEEAGSKSISF